MATLVRKGFPSSVADESHAMSEAHSKESRLKCR